MNVTIFETAITLICTILVGVITYIVKRLDATPARKEFDVTVQLLETGIEYNKAQLEEMKRVHELELKELKELNEKGIARFEKAIDKINTKLDEINDKIK